MTCARYALREVCRWVNCSIAGSPLKTMLNDKQLSILRGCLPLLVPLVESTACHVTTVFTPGVTKFQRVAAQYPGHSTKMLGRG